MAMKVCVVGAGAIGGLLGGKLALSGESVSFIEKHPAHREAINRNGLTIRMPGGEELVAKGVKASEDMGEPGPQDLVIIAVKAHQISALVPGIRKLFGKDTIVVTVQNGIPWWYFRRHGGPFDGKRLESLDRGRAHHRLRRLSGGRSGGSRGGQMRGGRPLPGRRARRQQEQPARDDQ